MNNLVKPSFYNIVIEAENHGVIYNTLTGQSYVYSENQKHFIDGVLKEDFITDINDSRSIIQTLYGKGILVDQNRNELEEVQIKENQGFYGDYLNVIILPTEQCSFRCIYCYEEYQRGVMDEKTQSALVQFIADRLAHYKGLVVSWFGGEPLEALDVIVSLSHKLMNLCKSLGKIYQAGMTTNGYLLTENVARELLKCRVFEYQITLDGLPQRHDKQRKLSDGSPTAKVIWNNLENIKRNISSKYLRIILRTNFTKAMISEAEAFFQLLEETFLKDSRFSMYWQVVEDYGFLRDDSLRNSFLSFQEYTELIKQYCFKANIQSFYDAMKPDGSICYALKRNALVIGSDGTIKKCTCDMESDQNRFGTINSGIDEDKLEKWLAADLEERERCISCKKRPICHGRTCYKNIVCPPNLFFMEDLLKKMLNERMK